MSHGWLPYLTGLCKHSLCEGSLGSFSNKGCGMERELMVGRGKVDLFSNSIPYIYYSDIPPRHFPTVAQRKLFLCSQNSIKLMFLGSHYFNYFLWADESKLINSSVLKSSYLAGNVNVPSPLPVNRFSFSQRLPGDKVPSTRAPQTFPTK